ncbi:unnamed protein product, partial [Mycena citricolor]
GWPSESSSSPAALRPNAVILLGKKLIGRISRSPQNRLI